MNHFTPKRPNPYILEPSDATLANYGELNAIVDQLNQFNMNQSITAFAGGGQASGTLLIVGINIVTTATTGDSVNLPCNIGPCSPTSSCNCCTGNVTLDAAGPVIIKNSGPGTLSIFPCVGDTIDGGAVNAAITIASGGSVWITKTGCNTWVSFACSLGCAGITTDTTLTGTGTAASPLSVVSSGGTSLVSAQYSQIGSQPGTIAAAQPITFTTGDLLDASITSVVGVGPVGGGTGTIFTFTTAGRYQMSYAATPLSGPADAGIVIYQGANVAGMLPIPYTMSGTLNTTQMSRTVIVAVSAGDKIALMAAAGNTAAVQFGPNSSTTNAASTTISFLKVS